MKKSTSLKESAGWAELPTGIFTADGIWFHTTEAALREFAEEVVEKIGVGPLVMQAGIWLRSADAAGALALAILLLVTTPLIAVLVSLLLYVLWEILSPTFVIVPVVRLFSVLSSAAFQGLLFVVVISWLGMNGHTTGAVVGLLAFILLRWGIVRKIVSKSVIEQIRTKQKLPDQDRILRSLVVRHAIALRISLPATESYEKRILEIWNRGKRK